MRADTHVVPPAESPHTTILMYHSVCVRQGQGDFARFVLDPAEFESHLAYLAEQHRPTVTVDGLGHAPPGAVCLTFDDAYADFYEVVFPLLGRYGACASLFLPTQYIDHHAVFLAPSADADRPLMTWSQVREMRDSGLVEIGAHSHTHPQLDRVDLNRLRAEVRLPKEAIQQELQESVRSFAYPFGYQDRRCRREVANAGYEFAVQVSERPAPANGDRFAVPRFTVNRGTSIESLQAMLAARPSREQSALATTKRLLWRGMRGARREVAAPAEVAP